MHRRRGAGSPARSRQNGQKAAGQGLAAKQAPHRPGTAPALGLRAGKVAAATIRLSGVIQDTSSGANELDVSLNGVINPATPTVTAVSRRPS